MIEKITALFNSFIGVLDSVRVFFEGSKVYIVGCIMIGLGIYQNDQKMILEGLGFIATRAAISKIGQ